MKSDKEIKNYNNCHMEIECETCKLKEICIKDVPVYIYTK